MEKGKKGLPVWWRDLWTPLSQVLGVTTTATSHVMACTPDRM